MEQKKLLKKTEIVSMLCFLVLLLESCGSVPFTGRRQLQLVSDQEVLSLSVQQYRDFIRTAPVERGTPNAEMVSRVGHRIANAVKTFYTNNGQAAELADYEWEFSLVKENSVNAFAMPGGKVVVYTGLLPVTQTEEALAVVLGHEIAHVLARHSSERMSQQVALQYGGAIAGEMLGNSQAMRQIGSTVFGLGAQYGVMMPYARKQESEADEVGLILMAMAGYDPRVAVPFWTRMAQSSAGSQVPEFMSTHPDDNKRIARIEAILPNVLPYYKGAGMQNNTKEPIKTKGTPTAPTGKTKTSEEWHF